MMVISVKILIYVIGIVCSMVHAQNACETIIPVREPGICVPINKCPHFDNIEKPYSPKRKVFLKKNRCRDNVEYVCCAKRFMFKSERDENVNHHRPQISSNKVNNHPGNSLNGNRQNYKNKVYRPAFNSMQGHYNNFFDRSPQKFVDLSDSTKLNPRPRSPVDSIESHPSLRLVNSEYCGKSFQNKVLDGENAALGEFPWVVQLEYNTIYGKPQCSGSLISKRYVLTVAHCVVKTNVKAIRLGEYDTSKDPDCYNIGNDCMPRVQIIPIEKIVPHPKFNKKAYANDVAVVRMQKDADINHASVLPICLPTTTALRSTRIQEVTIAGWGLTKSEKGVSILQKGHLSVIDNEKCQRDYGIGANLTASQICAGGEGVSCKGDSGGPLFTIGQIQSNNVETFRYVQYGIISFGSQFCAGVKTGQGIHVRVSHYMKWILDQMKP